MVTRTVFLALGLFSFFLVSGGVLGDDVALPVIDNVAADDGDDCKPNCLLDPVTEKIDDMFPCKPLC